MKIVLVKITIIFYWYFLTKDYCIEGNQSIAPGGGLLFPF